MLMLVALPIQRINAEENNCIPIEMQEKLNTYITYPNDIDEWGNNGSTKDCCVYRWL